LKDREARPSIIHKPSYSTKSNKHDCTGHEDRFALVVSFARDPRVFTVWPNELPSKYNEDLIDYYERYLRV
jgi:hypothetical protein